MDFFYKYFIKPIERNEGYNVVNTAFYSFLFFLFAYLLYKYLKKLKVKINLKFALASSSYVFLGIQFRLLEDMGLLNKWLFSSPQIWFIFLPIALLLLYIGKRLEKDKILSLNKFLFYFSISFALPIFILYILPQVKNFKIFLAFLFFSIPSSVFILIRKKVSFLKDKFSLAVLLIHLFDASVTFTTLTFFNNYFEQHVYASFFINKFGTPSIYFAVLLIILPYLYYANKLEDKNLSNFLKFAAFVAGFSPACRDFLRVLLLT